MSSIPQEMRDLPQWMGVKQGSKIPFHLVNNALCAASSSNPETWTTFDKITDAIVKKQFDNYGFAFADNGIVGIDIDAGFGADGFLSPLAIDIMNACKSYAEYSRSGRGMHIYVKGKLPFGGRNNRNGVEIYQSGRYFIVTGRKLIFEDLIENQKAIDYIVDKYFPETIVVNEATGKPRTQTFYSPIYKVSTGDKLTVEVEYPDIPNGCRNTSLTSLAGQLCSRGYSKEQVLQELIKVNNEKCKPPLDMSEINAIIRSMMRYSRG